jgi:tetratricopeptide (TPR) repeat protein
MRAASFLLVTLLSVGAAAQEAVSPALPHFQAGVDALKTKNVDLAIDKFRLAGEADAKFLPALLNLGRLLMEKGQVDEAEKVLLRALDVQGDFAPGLVNLGVLYQRRGEAEKALSFFERAHKADPENTAAMNNLAAIALAKGDSDRALSLARQVLARDVKNGGAYNILGGVYHRQKKHDLALFVFNKAVELDKGNADIYNNRGITELARGDVKAAAKDFREALALRPTFVAARFNQAALYLRYHQWTRAAEEYKKLAEGDAKSLEAQLGLAAALWGSKDLKGAEAAYLKVLEIDAKNRSALQKLASLYQNFLNQPEKALLHYQKYVELHGSGLSAQDPVHTNIRMLQKQIERAKQKGPDEPKKPEGAPGAPAKAEEKKPEPPKPGEQKAEEKAPQGVNSRSLADGRAWT